MLTANRLSKSFGVETILDAATFSLDPGERIGLVGPNGCGKTTLLRILAGLDQPDSGSAHLTPSDLRVGYLPQGLDSRPDETIGGFLACVQDDVQILTAKVERLAEALARTPTQLDLQCKYDATLARLSAAWANSRCVPEVMSALGLEQWALDIPIASLSGGQKTRLALAGLLLSNPQLVLLDEPTNHLDIGMLEWLERWLTGFLGAALIVSHDRTFLDRTVTRILELDPITHTVREYAGNYTGYMEQKQAEQERQGREYTDQQKEAARLQSAARHLRGLTRFKRGGKADSGDKFARGFFANRGLGTMGRAKKIERRIEHLLTDEKVDKPQSSWQLKVDFGDVRYRRARFSAFLSFCRRCCLCAGWFALVWRARPAVARQPCGAWLQFLAARRADQPPGYPLARSL